MKLEIYEWIIVLAMVSILASAVFLPFVQCKETAAQMNVPYKFGFFTTGCMIEHKPNQWVPLKNYRAL